MLMYHLLIGFQAPVYTYSAPGESQFLRLSVGLAANNGHVSDNMFANAAIFELGIPNAGNSDFPVSGLNPLLRIQSLVTRRSKQSKVYGESQRLDVEQALYAYTMGGAFGSMEEDVKGSISVGKYADFIVLSEDPRSTEPGRIKEIQVMQTYSDGVLRYQRDES